MSLQDYPVIELQVFSRELAQLPHPTKLLQLTREPQDLEIRQIGVLLRHRSVANQPVLAKPSQWLPLRLRQSASLSLIFQLSSGSIFLVQPFLPIGADSNHVHWLQTRLQPAEESEFRLPATTAGLLRLHLGAGAALCRTQ